ncbi:MAG TPA: 2-hydroxyacid dehydrogenase [Bryobacteraceae bacterium]|nr:2-hydroxyacid dehydrogenase [Bryobacteraceae bacterium]
MSYRVGFFLRACEDVYGAVRNHLPPEFELVTLTGNGPDEEEEAIRNLDFLIAVKVTARMIRNAPRLRLIQLPGVGYDKVDLCAAANAGIAVAQSIAGSSEAVAEHALMLMLTVSRRLVELCNSTRGGDWLMWERRTISHSLCGKVLGIAGMGRTGSEVARRAAGFGMQVQYFDIRTVDGWDRVSLQTLLSTSDLVSLHLPLDPSTRGLFGANEFRMMKQGSIFINTARGELVDEAALYEALLSGRLAGAGLDVFDPEPPAASNPLFSLEQVVVTPHVATGTLDSLMAKSAMYVENIRRVLAGEAPIGVLPVQVHA